LVLLWAAATLARGKTRRERDTVHTSIEQTTRVRWVRCVLDTTFTGHEPAPLALTWQIDPKVHSNLETEIFVTDRGYRS
jgi:hypothetical protein